MVDGILLFCNFDISYAFRKYVLILYIILYRVSKKHQNANSGLNLKLCKLIMHVVYNIELISFQIQQTRSKSVAKWPSYIVNLTICEMFVL